MLLLVLLLLVGVELLPDEALLLLVQLPLLVSLLLVGLSIVVADIPELIVDSFPLIIVPLIALLLLLLISIIIITVSLPPPLITTTTLPPKRIPTLLLLLLPSSFSFHPLLPLPPHSSILLSISLQPHLTIKLFLNGVQPVDDQVGGVVVVVGLLGELGQVVVLEGSLHL